MSNDGYYAIYYYDDNGEDYDMLCFVFIKKNVVVKNK